MRDPALDDRVVVAKHNLDEKLLELARRVDRAREALSSEHLLGGPWRRAGLAIAFGFAAGYLRSSSVARTSARLLVSAGVRYLVREAIAATA